MAPIEARIRDPEILTVALATQHTGADKRRSQECPRQEAASSMCLSLLKKQKPDSQRKLDFNTADAGQAVQLQAVEVIRKCLEPWTILCGAFCVNCAEPLGRTFGAF